MSSFGKRVLTTVVAVPTIFCIIFFLPQKSYLALTLLVMGAAVISARELKQLYTKAENADLHIHTWMVALLPLAKWLEIAYFQQFPLLDLTIVVLAIFVYATELFTGPNDSFSKTLSRIGGSSLLIIYPGLLMTFLIRIAAFPHASAYLILFFLLVFGNDVFAFIFGMSFGKNNKGIFKVSPNKSIAGFLGGLAMTIVLSVIYCYFIPGVREEISLLEAILLGLATNTSANIGDLIESAFKRAAKVKDSGTIIPGRGGLLDSIDSILASAPVFWVLLRFF
ncbi:putative CDP-diglyceride synthetase/phosphatidate cytidylyltransferase [Sphaerochaeta pleomorpha str. Grapes]|uniref:Phosphatidate cytidylyltransferase n=1 Tax=Sphaerochaeta pleomorpha (strain ATCC BAA-1885 / DSM 22778 / Grapes) TaxID=158190 RepID=G8QXY4_SPHPG|nr:phosphatidate cytidylyltransferase [Sphaerochaeta pleomorpha]AEV28489.1 putative CDP-diglyceride synthetase/phosphatidate cytidylyltransferase [Sphaerochaeta pleomorpha str. Grapes]